MSIVMYISVCCPDWYQSMFMYILKYYIYTVKSKLLYISVYACEYMHE